MAGEAEKLCREMHSGAPGRWLSLLGTSGAGKTHLARTIIRWAKNLHEDRIDKQRTTESEIVRKKIGLLRWSQCCDWMVTGDYGWIPQAKSDWLVCLDDIGVEYKAIRALAASKLYEILEARRERYTIITANCSLDDIANNLDARISSRLIRDRNITIEVDVPDFSLR